MYQIVVQSFPDPNAGKWQISGTGRLEPKWKHDAELYHLGSMELMSVPISVKGDRMFEPAAQWHHLRNRLR
jgi:hypothetical protein